MGYYLIGNIIFVIYLFGGVEVLDKISLWLWKIKNQKSGEDYSKTIGYNKNYYLFPLMALAIFILMAVLVSLDFQEAWADILSGDIFFQTMFVLACFIGGIIGIIYFHKKKVFYSNYSVKISRMFHKTKIIRWTDVQETKVIYNENGAARGNTAEVLLCTKDGVHRIEIPDTKKDEFSDFMYISLHHSEIYDTQVKSEYKPVDIKREKKQKKLKILFYLILFPILFFFCIEDWERYGNKIVFLILCVILRLISLIFSKKDGKKDQLEMDGQELYVYRTPAGIRGFIAGITILMWIVAIFGFIVIPCTMGALETARDTVIIFGTGSIICLTIYSVVMWRAFPGMWTDVYFNKEKIIVKRGWKKKTVRWHELGETKVKRHGVIIYDRYGKKMFAFFTSYDGYGEFKRIYEERLPHHSDKPIPKATD